MKKALIVCLFMAGMTAMAQERGVHRDHFKDMTPEQIATLTSKRMALALDLSEEQRGQVMQLQLQRAKTRMAKMEERKATQDENKAPGAEDRFNRANRWLDAQIAYKSAMKEILSEDQYARWEEIHVRKGNDNFKRQHRHGHRTRR